MNSLPYLQDNFDLGQFNLNKSGKLIFWARVGTNQCTTLRLASESAPYQIPTGKKLVIFGIIVKCLSVTSPGTMQLGYGDSAVSNDAAPANAVYLNDDSAQIAAPAIFSVIGSQGFPAFGRDFIAGKYPFIQSSGMAGTALVIAELLDA